jgi:hypothetical protein
MSNNRTVKKQKKQLIHDYYEIVSPSIKPKRIFIIKDVLGLDQRFEVFTPYKTNGGTMTSNTTPFITQSNTSTINA